MLVLRTSKIGLFCAVLLSETLMFVANPRPLGKTGGSGRGSRSARFSYTSMSVTGSEGTG